MHKVKQMGGQKETPSNPRLRGGVWWYTDCLICLFSCAIEYIIVFYGIKLYRHGASYIPLLSMVPNE